MSRTKPTEYEKPSLEWTGCAWCGANAGTWCTTSSGFWAQYLHGARTAAFWQGYQAGHKSAERGLLEIATSTDPADQAWWARRLQRFLQEQK